MSQTDLQRSNELSHLADEETEHRTPLLADLRLWAAAGFVLLLIAPYYFYPVMVAKVLCFALFAAAFNLLLGFAGLLSFGHAAFFGFSAYVTGYCLQSLGFTAELGILAGTAAGALLGLLMGLLAIRRQGIYFAMITLALAQMVYFVCLQAPFTGGEDGLQGVPRRALFGIFDMTRNIHVYYLVLAVFCIGIFIIYRTVHSPFGQVLKSIRENEDRAISLGYDADRYKLLAFVLSAALSGLAGSTKVMVFQLASLTDVQWQMSGEVVLMAVLGGIGTMLGPIVGASIIIVLQNELAQIGSLTTIVQGAVFVVCVLLFRRGIVGEVSHRFNRWRGRAIEPSGGGKDGTGGSAPWDAAAGLLPVPDSVGARDCISIGHGRIGSEPGKRRGIIIDKMDRNRRQPTAVRGLVIERIGEFRPRQKGQDGRCDATRDVGAATCAEDQCQIASNAAEISDEMADRLHGQCINSFQRSVRHFLGLEVRRPQSLAGCQGAVECHDAPPAEERFTRYARTDFLMKVRPERQIVRRARTEIDMTTLARHRNPAIGMADQSPDAKAGARTEDDARCADDSVARPKRRPGLIGQCSRGKGLALEIVDGHEGREIESIHDDAGVDDPRAVGQGNAVAEHRARDREQGRGRPGAHPLPERGGQSVLKTSVRHRSLDRQPDQRLAGRGDDREAGIGATDVADDDGEWQTRLRIGINRRGVTAELTSVRHECLSTGGFAGAVVAESSSRRIGYQYRAWSELRSMRMKLPAKTR